MARFRRVVSSLGGGWPARRVEPPARPKSQFLSAAISASTHNDIDREALSLIEAGIEKSGWKSRKDSPDLLQALEGMRLKASDDFPQGD